MVLLVWSNAKCSFKWNYNFILVFSIHLFAILNNLYTVTYSILYSIYIWQGCLIESQRLMFKKSDTLSLIQLHFLINHYHVFCGPYSCWSCLTAKTLERETSLKLCYTEYMESSWD